MSQEQARRRFFQQAKGFTNERFWLEMNRMHSNAYYKAAEHYKTAAEATLPPRYAKMLHAKAEEIRELWDGLHEIEVDYSSLSLEDVLLEVKQELSRANGAAFGSIAEARGAIVAEYIAVWEAIDLGQRQRASMELVQLIGHLVKLMRGLGSLVEVMNHDELPCTELQ